MSAQDQRKREAAEAAYEFVVEGEYLGVGTGSAVNHLIHMLAERRPNKTRDIAAHFAWAHAIDRFKIARRLSEQRPEELPAINLCIQINIDGQDSKSGVAPDARGRSGLAYR